MGDVIITSSKPNAMNVFLPQVKPYSTSTHLSSGHLDPGWYVDADQGRLTRPPQVVDVKLCLALVLEVVLHQHLPGHLHVNIRTLGGHSEGATEFNFIPQLHISTSWSCSGASVVFHSTKLHRDWDCHSSYLQLSMSLIFQSSKWRRQSTVWWQGALNTDLHSFTLAKHVSSSFPVERSCHSDRPGDGIGYVQDGSTVRELCLPELCLPHLPECCHDCQLGHGGKHHCENKSDGDWF